MGTATGLAPNEVHMERLPRTVFDCANVGQHQSSDRDHLTFSNLSRDTQQKAHDLLRQQHALTVTQIELRNSSLLDRIA